MRAAAGSFRDVFLVARHNRGEIVAVDESRPMAGRNECSPQRDWLVFRNAAVDDEAGCPLAGNIDQRAVNTGMAAVGSDKRIVERFL